MAPRPEKSAARPAQEHDPQQAAIVDFVKARGMMPAGASAHFQSLTGGGSHATRRLRIHDRDSRVLHDLVVKIAPPDGPLAPYDVAREARMMRAAAAAAPVPEVIGYVAEPPAGSYPFLVMRFVEGTTPSLRSLPELIAQRTDAFRLELARNVVRTLVRLGSTAAPENVVSLRALYVTRVESLRDAVITTLDAVMPIPPLVPLAADWLIRHYPEETGTTPCLVHGDFRIGNLTFGRNEIEAVLDWERAGAGHPLHDLGYFCLPGMKRGPHIGGLMTQEELEHLWMEESGLPLDVRTCAYFRILAMYVEYCSMMKAIVRSARSGDALWGVPLLKLVTRLEIELPKAVRCYTNEQYSL